MAIIIKGSSKKDQINKAKSLKSLRAGEVVPTQKKEKPAPVNYVQKIVQQAAVQAKTNEKTSSINNGIIKPKYIQDKSVVYKKSGYVKDLLGEGN